VAVEQRLLRASAQQAVTHAGGLGVGTALLLQRHAARARRRGRGKRAGRGGTKTRPMGPIGPMGRMT
jgi:hypothetical protein